MTLEATLRERILLRLGRVIDPETGVNVLQMRLVEDLEVNEDTGEVQYTFRPSSYLCPLAHSLALDIKHAVGEIRGVTAQRITVAGYVKAEELSEIINQEDV